MKLAAWFAIAVGVLMSAQWGFFLLSGQAPEVQTEPVRLSFHLVAEGATAVGLIVAGVGLLDKQQWAKRVCLFAAGMLAYSVIVSPGYFAQRGEWGLVAMFAVLLGLTAASVSSLVRAPAD